jgi:hypothetical protein
LTEKGAIFCVRYSQNYKLTPAPSENCFAIFLLRVRSNKHHWAQSVLGSMGDCYKRVNQACCMIPSLAWRVRVISCTGSGHGLSHTQTMRALLFTNIGYCACALFTLKKYIILNRFNHTHASIYFGFIPS